MGGSEREFRQNEPIFRGDDKSLEPKISLEKASGHHDASKAISEPKVNRKDTNA